MRTTTIRTAAAMTAIGLFLLAGNAHALLDDNSTNATAIQGQLQGQGQKQKQGQAQGQLQGQQQKWSQDLGDSKYKVPAQAPGIVVTQPGVGAAVTQCIIKGLDEAEAFGIGVGTGLEAMPSAGLGYAYSDTDVMLDTGCRIGNAAARLTDMGLYDAAAKTMCQDEFAVEGINAAEPGFCNGITQVSNYAVQVTMTNNVVNRKSVAPVAVAARVAASQPTGNAINGRCALGFDATTGQCAKKQAAAYIGREDS